MEIYIYNNELFTNENPNDMDELIEALCNDDSMYTFDEWINSCEWDNWTDMDAIDVLRQENPLEYLRKLYLNRYFDDVLSENHIPVYTVDKSVTFRKIN